MAQLSRHPLRRRVVELAFLAGVNVYMPGCLRHVPLFVRQLYYKRRVRGGRFPLKTGQLAPILTDYDRTAGAASGHYFHQDLWVA